MSRAIDVDVTAHTSHHLAVEHEWENVDGIKLIGPADGPPPRLVITITQLDDCPADPPPDAIDGAA